MVCPRCGANPADDDAAFCSHCGALLSPMPPRRRRARRRRPTGLPVAELFAALRGSFSPAGWLDAARAACVLFLATLCVGAVLVVGAKLGQPALGAGANPLSIFTAVVILANASLGSPVHVGDLEVHVLPLGALVVIGAAGTWAASKIVATRTELDERRAAIEGAKMAAPFALLVWSSALVFRFRSPVTPVAAGAGEALVLAAVWGALFGGLGGWWSRSSATRGIGRVLDLVRARSRAAYEGVVAGGVMLVVAAAVVGASAGLWSILSLVRQSLTRPPSVALVLAALIFVVAFLPNLVVTLLALAVGAPVEVGARLRLGGRSLGPLRELSLADWGGATTPWYLWLLVLVPLFACLLGGFAARRNSTTPQRAPEVLAAAAVAFAAPLGIAAELAPARLGAGLVAARGFAHVAPDAWATFLWALGWAVVVGFLGWKVAETHAARTRAPESHG
jgi:zinc-ribbon domain